MKMPRTFRLFPLAAFVAGALAILPSASLRAEVAVHEAETSPRFVPPQTEFFIAAATGDINTLQRCLDEGVSVDAVVPQPVPDELNAVFSQHSRGGMLLRDPGATALMLATAAGKPDAMALLIGAKANREARTHSDTRPLDIAAERDDIAAMQMLIGVTPDSDAARLSVLVDLTAQRATVSKDGQPILTTKVSSGKKEKPTPPGKYVVTHKYPEWHSTLYHNASMPFFMRLSCSAVGLHAGVVPNYPASHGCVRLPPDFAKKLYAMIPRGTLVEIR